MISSVAAFIVAAIAMLGLGRLGLLASLGAHPFWADWTVPALGVLVALLPIALGVYRRGAGLALAAVMLLGGALAARFGKQVFVASFAENGLAGDFWFFGWIVLCAGATAIAGLGLQVALRRRIVG